MCQLAVAVGWEHRHNRFSRGIEICKKIASHDGTIVGL